jgi:sugar/nucleoside kinase (ribokinase family)/predicted kinase
MPSVREILDAFKAAGTSDAAVEAIASLELSADDLLDLDPAEVWGVADDDAVRICDAIEAFNSPPRMIQPPGPPPPPGALPAMPGALPGRAAPPSPSAATPSPSATTPATGARCLVVAGPPGAGKTTLAAHAAAHLKAALIDKDALEWPLANCALVAAGAAKDDAYYNSTVKPSAYETCFRVAAENCAAGIDVVMVAPFTSYVKDATFLATLARRFGARVALLWVFADPEALARRQRQRNADQDTSVKVTLPKPPACAHVLVDTSSIQEADMKTLAVDAVARAFSAEMTTGRVLCAGHVCVDVVLEGCGELESREGYCEVQSTRLAAGGSVANCASTLASLETYGVDAHCSVGDDAFGRFLLDYFRENNVGNTHVSVSSKHPTSTACLPVYKKDGKRAVYCAQGWNAHFVPDVDVDTYDAILLGYPHVMPALRGAPLARFAAKCVAAGTCLCLDVNEACDDYKLPLGDASDAYADVGVLHGNLDEAAACVGRKKEFLERYNIRDGLENVLSMSEIESIARSLLRRGCGVVLFTLGPLGAFAMTNDEPTLRRTLGRIEHGLAPSHVSRRAAFKADGAIDTVGAGDAFLAGAVASLLAGGDLDRVLDVGLAAALWRVDASRSSRPPRRGELEAVMGGLERLPTVARTVYDFVA